MSDVQFYEEPEISIRRKKKQKGGSLTALVIKYKLAKDEKQASMVLLVIIALCVVTTIGLYFVSKPKAVAPAAITAPLGRAI